MGAEPEACFTENKKTVPKELFSKAKVEL